MIANTKADVTPMKPKKGALVGHVSVDMVFPLYVVAPGMGTCADTVSSSETCGCVCCGHGDVAADSTGSPRPRAALAGPRVRWCGLAEEVTAASALARMTANNDLRHGYRTLELIKLTGAASPVNYAPRRVNGACASVSGR